jgi:hypothetical protein
LILESRLAFTNAIAGWGFRLSPSCSPIRFGLVFPRGCLFIPIVDDKRTLSFPKIDGEKKKLRQPLACLNHRDPITTEPRIFHTSSKPTHRVFMDFRAYTAGTDWLMTL